MAARPVEYRVLRELGRGSFGKVCLARAYTAQRERLRVALKFAREAANVELGGIWWAQKLCDK